MKSTALLLLLCGCVSAPTITYEQDRFGVPSCVVDGERYEMTEAERKAVAQNFVNAYCPAEPSD